MSGTATYAFEGLVDTGIRPARRYKGDSAKLIAGTTYMLTSVQLNVERCSWGPRRLRLSGSFTLKESRSWAQPPSPVDAAGYVATLLRWTLTTVYDMGYPASGGLGSVSLPHASITVREVESDAR